MGVGGVGVGVCGAINSGGPLSGPASPTPSVSEEPTTSSHHSSHHHHHSASYSHHSLHHSHHHHSHHLHHAANQQQQPQLSTASRPTSPSAQPSAAAVLHQDTVAAAAAIAAAEQRQRELEGTKLFLFYIIQSFFFNFLLFKLKMVPFLLGICKEKKKKMYERIKFTKNKIIMNCVYQVPSVFCAPISKTLQNDKFMQTRK